MPALEPDAEGEGMDHESVTPGCRHFGEENSLFEKQVLSESAYPDTRSESCSKRPRRRGIPAGLPEDGTGYRISGFDAIERRTSEYVRPEALVATERPRRGTAQLGSGSVGFAQ